MILFFLCARLIYSPRACWAPLPTPTQHAGKTNEDYAEFLFTFGCCEFPFAVLGFVRFVWPPRAYVYGYLSEWGGLPEHPSPSLQATKGWPDYYRSQDSRQLRGCMYYAAAVCGARHARGADEQASMPPRHAEPYVAWAQRESVVLYQYFISVHKRNIWPPKNKLGKRAKTRSIDGEC